MNGFFINSVNTLREVIEVIPQAGDFDWAISLQSGPFRDFHFLDQNDSRNVLQLLHDFSDSDPWWFRRGILPRYATDLLLDEWSYYLGFDAASIDPPTFCLDLNGDISPRPALFETLAGAPCIYIMHIDDWWWEAYTGIAELRNILANRWDRRTISSARWDGRIHNLHPFPDITG